MLIGRPTADWDAYGSDAHAAQDAGESREIDKESHDVNAKVSRVWPSTRTN